MKHCLVFASLISPSKMILFEKKYQTFDTVFHHQMKHLEVRQKYSAARRIFNSLLGVSSGDETLHLMFDILLELFSGKLLLTETIMCFSICKCWLPLALEILLCEQRRTDPRRVPKNNYIFEYPWNLVYWQNAMRVSLKKSAS